MIDQIILASSMIFYFCSAIFASAKVMSVEWLYFYCHTSTSIFIPFDTSVVTFLSYAMSWLTSESSVFYLSDSLEISFNWLYTWVSFLAVMQAMSSTILQIEWSDSSMSQRCCSIWAYSCKVSYWSFTVSADFSFETVSNLRSISRNCAGKICGGRELEGLDSTIYVRWSNEDWVWIWSCSIACSSSFLDFSRLLRSTLAHSLSICAGRSMSHFICRILWSVSKFKSLISILLLSYST